jgi:hypothetical protein
MKPFDYYSKPQTLYPNKKDYITFYAYDKGECLDIRPNFYTSKKQVEGDYPNAVIQEVLDEDVYKAHRKEYDAESAKLHQEFQNDLFEDYDVSDNPKRFKCFELAWEHGHSSGLEEVYNYFGDFVELIRD